MIVYGKIIKLGDNINTDEIIPARYLNTSDEKELAVNVLEDVRPGFGKRKDIKGKILVAGDNFGCGSSREHAPLAIKAIGISCIIAKSFARIFFRNSINIGLPLLECSDAVDTTKSGDKLEIDLSTGKITNLTQGLVFTANPYPDFMSELFSAGGLIEYTKKRVTRRS